MHGFPLSYSVCSAQTPVAGDLAGVCSTSNRPRLSSELVSARWRDDEGLRMVKVEDAESSVEWLLVLVDVLDKGTVLLIGGTIEQKQLLR